MSGYQLPTFEEELTLKEQGFAFIAGVDEAGAGCWAGPVCAAAVILRHPIEDKLVRDSKTLSPSQRERAAVLVRESAVAWAVGMASPKEIDRINIRRASALAMARAIRRLSLTPDYVLIDAFGLKDLGTPNKGIIRGDSISMSIAAASIIAKTERDYLMERWAYHYPEYCFEAHKGYGTKLHMEALDERGPCPLHRMSYRPVKAYTKAFAEKRQKQKIHA